MVSGFVATTPFLKISGSPHNVQKIGHVVGTNQIPKGVDKPVARKLWAVL